MAPGLEALRIRSRPIAAASRRLRDLERAGRLKVPFEQLALSFTHMHVNRASRSAQRMQELVLYDFLHRHYRSVLARGARS
jgi:thiopeptide-type bacteriocin biosynthesis protein